MTSYIKLRTWIILPIGKRLICEVMRQGSLAAAATALGASPSFVGKRLALLEASLGTRLLHRTTRRIVFTDDDETVYR